MKNEQLFARLLLVCIAVFLLSLALTFAGCAAHRPEPVAPVSGLSVAVARPDSIPRPGLLSGIGNLFSTPQGRANRQAVRIAQAAVPRKLGKGAIYAVNSRIASAFKAKAPTVLADSGASVNNAAANSQQQAVKGNGNQLTAKQANPTQQAAGPLAVLMQNLTGWIPWVLAGAFILAVVFRKRLPIVGPFFS